MPKRKPWPVTVSKPQKARSKLKAGIPLDELLAAHASGRSVRDTKAPARAPAAAKPLKTLPDNFVGHMGPFDAHGGLESPAKISIGSSIDITGIGTKIPIGISAVMTSNGNLIGVARAGNLETPVDVSLPRV